ncbi:TetR/AcrR family transcriptional regulator [Curtobacterium albidum]|uniref:TetR/AcrR family transcriptional regulator n=1 Tax=Curtobacterium TaxID=2034 RepID=UPI0020268A3A|nr:TetR/AcrR family transcriptional regulator [Curtobacterium albidum]MCL9665922.1 TetR/AcrR family transcriptional regulator [Curtobacterium albidum]
MADMHGGRVEDDASSAERIVRGAIRAFRLHPFHEVDAGTVTETCGVDRTVVDRLFPTWDGLLLVAYDRWLQLRGSRRSSVPRCTIDHVRMTLAEDVADPGLVRLLAGVLPLAASERDFAGFFRKRFEEYVEELTVGLQRDVATGVETIGIPAHQAATQLLAVHEGLQVQMLVRPYLDVLVEYDRAVHTLRHGWRQPEPVAWDLDAALVLG